MKSRARLLVLTVAVLFALANRSEAVESPMQEVAGPEQTKSVSLNLVEFETSYVFGSDLHRSGSFGDQSAIQNSFSYTRRVLLHDHLYWHLGIAYDRFDFGTTGAPVPDHLQSAAVVLGIDYMHNDDVGAFIQIRPGFYTEDNFNNASFDVPITVARIWVLQEDHLYLFSGVNAAFLRGRFPVIPLVGLIWEPNDKWRVFALLPEPRVIYKPNGNWEFWAGGELTGGSFRTDRKTGIFPPELNGAQVDYAEYRVGGGLIYSPSDRISVDIGGGYAIQREFDFYRADVKYKTDGAPYLRLQFKSKF